jgi:uncharacterized LabA/DUF88 family protein
VGRLAIFIDGGYIKRIARDDFKVSLDYGKLSQAITKEIGNRSAEPVELLRTLYYDCLPYQSPKPTVEESERFGKARKFFDALGSLSRFEVRLGRLHYRGDDSHGRPIFQQKRVDLLLGLDFALLAGRHQIGHAVIISGDADLIPAVEVAKQEGVCVWLFHGPAPSYARELWNAADERVPLTQPFMASIAR